MTSLNVSLPEAMRNWIDRQVKEGGYGTASEFVREVLREARKTRARRELEEKLIEGIKSGPATPMTKADWARIRQRAIKRASKRRPR